MMDLFTYRKSDPITSREAGEAATRFRSGDHAQILSALSDGFPRAAEEVSIRLGWDDHVRVNRRFGELERAGLVERTEFKHINRSGRAAFRYKICRPATVGRCE